ncbi:hypothetical protein J2S50_003738 [Streptomyces sp. DSM 40167]|nr:hypothetical protein [Streptomyces sp. DSM 40167]
MDDALSRNRLARAITSTTDLDEAEAYSREVCGYSEIDYERNKALWLNEHQPTDLDPPAIHAHLEQFEAEARTRGATHTTFRRITEALGLSGDQRDELRQFLIARRPKQYEAPLWRIADEA